MHFDHPYGVLSLCSSCEHTHSLIIILHVVSHLFRRLWLIHFFLESSSSISPESGLGTSHSSLPGSGQDSSNDQRVHEDIYDPDVLQPLGTCKALYPFDGEQKLQVNIVLTLFILLFLHHNSYEWGQHTNGRRWRIARYRARSRRRLDTSTSNAFKCYWRRIRSYIVYRKHPLCVGLMFNDFGRDSSSTDDFSSSLFRLNIKVMRMWMIIFMWIRCKFIQLSFLSVILHFNNQPTCLFRQYQRIVLKFFFVFIEDWFLRKSKIKV